METQYDTIRVDGNWGCIYRCWNEEGVGALGVSGTKSTDYRGWWRFSMQL